MTDLIEQRDGQAQGAEVRKAASTANPGPGCAVAIRAAL